VYERCETQNSIGVQSTNDKENIYPSVVVTPQSIPGDEASIKRRPEFNEEFVINEWKPKKLINSGAQMPKSEHRHVQS